MQMDDQDFLQRAVEVGNRQVAPRNFGAIIVKNDEIIAEDCNHVHELNDPTAHAETSAIRAACQKLGTHNLEGCTLYSSHEPCLMCFSCATWARMYRVVYAIPASERGSSYEFDDVNLKDLAKHLTRTHIKVELVRLT
jgi:guanine deaminase